MACQGKKPLIVYAVLIAIQVCLVAVLLVFAARGKSFMDESDSGSGIPYYIGALLVGSVYGCLAVSTLLLVVFYAFHIYKGSGLILCTVCILAFLGLPAFIIGVIFTALFGLANCKKNENTSYDLNGFCSYDTNIDNNYNTAIVCLTVIILLFFTNLVNVFLLCKYGGELEDEIIIPKGKRKKGGGAGGESSSDKKGGNRTLRMMVRDRKVRQDEQKQRRMGVPEHKITKKFMPKY